MVDLDRFKSVNDTRGHLTGDLVLREAARRMKDAVRQYDTLGRYGGEEFLIVLPGCEGASACAQAERIREAIVGGPFSDGTHSFQVTCSIGVSSRAWPTDEDTGTFIREADAALYHAKAEGRNRVVHAREDGVAAMSAGI